MTVDHTAQESEVRAPMSIVMEKAFETRLLRSRIEGLTAEQRYKMKLIGHEDKSRSNKKQEGHTIPPSSKGVAHVGGPRQSLGRSLDRHWLGHLSRPAQGGDQC